MFMDRTASVVSLARRGVSLALAIAAVQARAVAQTTATANGAVAPAFDARLPNVVVLATGRIAGGNTPAGSALSRNTGQLGVGQLLDAAPRARSVANLRGEEVSVLGSHDENGSEGIALATRVDELLATPDVNGVVIADGTGALDETAYFLNLVVKSDKPIVVTSAVLATRADIYEAVAMAASESAYGRGVLVVLNDSVRAAATRPNTRHGSRSEFSIEDTTPLPRVDIISATQDQSGALINAAAAAGARGIVLVDEGTANLTKLAEALSASAKTGLVCVLAPGRAGREAAKGALPDGTSAFVSSRGLDPVRARVLLRVALLSTTDPAQFQRYFDEY